ncbi:hypothetical protein BH11ARM1_BH11ARM1_11590 [soil metagenome]
MVFGILCVANGLGFGHRDAPDCPHCAQQAASGRRFPDNAVVELQLRLGAEAVRRAPIEAHQTVQQAILQVIPEKARIAIETADSISTQEACLPRAPPSEQNPRGPPSIA